MERLLVALRSRGATVIHAPSGCMRAYHGTPARQRALAVDQVPRPQTLLTQLRTSPSARHPRIGVGAVPLPKGWALRFSRGGEGRAGALAAPGDR
jgi:hypothetical protein